MSNAAVPESDVPLPSSGCQEIKDSVGTNKKSRRSPNTYVILFCVIVGVAILSWFIPGGAYDTDKAGHALAGTFHIVASKPQGLWDIALSPITGMLGSTTITGAIAISLFVMLFGSFLEMMEQTGAIKLALRQVTTRYQTQRTTLIVILVSIMAAFGTIEGAYEEGIVYLLMFIPVILALGLDTVTAVMIVVLGSQIGCLASTINPFAVGIASGIAGVSVGDGLGLRAGMLVGLTALTAVGISRYAKNVHDNPEKSTQFYRRAADLREFPVSTDTNPRLGNRQKWALTMFIGTFLLMIVALIPWSSLNARWTFFESFATGIGKTPVVGIILGADVVPFGEWYFPELSMLMLVMTLITGRIMHYDINKIIGIIIKGAAGLVPTAFVVPLARGIQVVMDNGKITPTILHLGESTLSALPPVAFVLISLFFYFILACFIPSSTGLAAATMSIMASLAQFAHVSVALMVTIYMMALGLAKMVTPTSIVLMTCTQAAHISYGDWLRRVGPFVAFLFGVCCCILVVAALVG